MAADEDVASDEHVTAGMWVPTDGSRVPGQIGSPVRPWIAMRILVVRLVAAVPLVLALANGSVQVVAIAYRELTVPSEVAVPIALRVLRAAPDALGLILLTWTLSEVIGAIAARRIVLSGTGAWAAFISAVVHVVRHPIRTSVEFLAPTVLLVAVLVPSAAAAAVAWDATRGALASGDGTSAIATATIVILFVGLFAGGLVLAGMAAAWRAAVWTVDLAASPERAGTFGGVPEGPHGEWQTVAGTANVAEPRPLGVDHDPR